MSGVLSRPRVLAGVILSLSAALLAGCSSANPAPAADSPIAKVALEPALDHLHGLHLDASGAVLAGTHTGVFQIETSGGTTKVGTSDDDFMGLAGVPGTDALFASGHPGPSSTAPNPLGLTASADGGRTWETRSLSGEIDFHALATDGEILVGFDGVTGIVASTDGGSTWTAGAAMSAAALAVTDTGVWATTADGLQRSTDAGRTFTVVPGAPALVLISAAADGSLWGVDTEGSAWRSKTGETWERRAAVGQVEAVLAVDFDSAHAVTAEALFTLG